MTEKYASIDLGWVTELGDRNVDRSVTWIYFAGIVLDNVEHDLGVTEDERALAQSIPVSTKDLIDAGVSLEPSEDGHIFVGATINNLDAPDKGDVQVSDFELSLPSTREALAAWQGII